MRKILIIGPVVTDITAHVPALPRGNEDMNITDSSQRVSGNGYLSAGILQNLGFPYLLCADCCGGIYGDYAYVCALAAGLACRHSEDLTAGCTYTVSDPEGNSTAMSVPGAEYGFDSSIAEDFDPQEYSCAILSGDMLCGDDADDLVEFLRDAELPLYFTPGVRTEELDERIMEAVFALEPVMIMSDYDAYILSGAVLDDLDAIVRLLRSQTGKPVVILRKGEGAYCAGEEGTMLAQQESVMHAGVFTAAYAAALSAGVDPKNALVYASEYAAEARDGMLSEAVYEKERKRLAGMILQK